MPPLLRPFLLSLTLLSSHLALAFPEDAYPQATCQEKVNQVIDKIHNEGVKKVSVEVRPGLVRHPNNPTSRSDELSIVMTPTNRGTKLIIEDIIKSPTLLRVWSDAVVVSCGSTAIVRFRVSRSNFVRAYYVQYDGTTRQVECVNFSSPNYPWGVEYCPEILEK